MTASLRQVVRDSQRKWRAAHANYQSNYWHSHPEAVEQNRQQQRLRDRKRRLTELVKNNLALDLKQAGAEVVLCTPHLPAPQLMAAASWQAVAAKPYIKFVRQTAASAQVALADVAARWNSLRREGLNPDFMLVDEVIHPNDRGHAIYAEELLKCFD